MKRYRATVRRFYDIGGDKRNGEYFIHVIDKENPNGDGYFFNSHPKESIRKNLGINYLEIIKRYPSAHREHETYSSVFIKDKQDARLIANEVNCILG
jgi:hypothetical protein